MSNLFLLYLTLQLCLVVRGLYFTVNKDEPKCFNLEQPRDTPIMFGYEILDDKHEIEFDLYYGSVALPDLHIMHKVLVSKVGHVDFIADNDGYYTYCLKQSLQVVDDYPTRIKLAVIYGFDSDHYEKLIKDHNFDAVNLQVHKLNDLLTMTLNEADYQKHKEVEYHSQTEKMNNAALWWPVVQIGILIIIGVFQVQHLKRFFKSNKLI